MYFTRGKWRSIRMFLMCSTAWASVFLRAFW